MSNVKLPQLNPNVKTRLIQEKDETGRVKNFQHSPRISSDQPVNEAGKRSPGKSAKSKPLVSPTSLKISDVEKPIEPRQQPLPIKGLKAPTSAQADLDKSSSLSAQQNALDLSPSKALWQKASKRILKPRQSVSKLPPIMSQQRNHNPFPRLSAGYLKSAKPSVENCDKYLKDVAYIREKLISAGVDAIVANPQKYLLGFR